MLGKTVDNRYEVLKFIGQGGFAEVYLAMDLKRRQVVAIKFLYSREAFSGNVPKEISARFSREVRLISKLSHPNLVKAFDAGSFEGKPYLVMEFIQGHTLRELIDQSGALPIEQALSVARQLADVLNYIHTHGVEAHRDLKPANVMITPEGRVKLMDLGIAKAIGLDSLETKSGLFMGTPHYISPEQADGAKHIDARSDIFSLGIVLYQMLTGKLPFDADSTWGILRKIIDPEEKEKPIRQIRPECPEWLARIVERAMAKSIKKRFQSSAELLTVLNEGDRPRVAKVSAPNLVGKSLEQMEKVALDSGLRIQATSRKYHPKAPKGVVMRQSVQPNAPLKPGDIIDVMISLGPEPKPTQAGEAIIRVRQEDRKSTSTPSVIVRDKEERMVSKAHPGEQEKRIYREKEGYRERRKPIWKKLVIIGVGIILVVFIVIIVQFSKNKQGEEKVNVPNLIGETVMDAENELKLLGYSVSNISYDDNSLIDEQNPKPGIKLNPEKGYWQAELIEKGIVKTVIIEPAHTEEIKVDGHYETEITDKGLKKIWVEGGYITKEMPQKNKEVKEPDKYKEVWYGEE